MLNLEGMPDISPGSFEEREPTWGGQTQTGINPEGVADFPESEAAEDALSICVIRAIRD